MPDVVGVSVLAGSLHVTLKNSPTSAELNSWFDKNAGELSTGYKVRALFVEKSLAS